LTCHNQKGFFDFAPKAETGEEKNKKMGLNCGGTRAAIVPSHGNRSIYKKRKKKSVKRNY